MKILTHLTALFLVAALTNGAAAQTPVKFAFDWKFEGPAAPYFVAIDNGYFAEAGLDVTIESGKGSLDAIPKVASGDYPFGFADFNSLAKYIDQNPGAPVIGVMIVYDVPPFAIISTKARGAPWPSDLEGKVLGAPAADGAFAQWPAFAAVAGIDASKVVIQDVSFAEREQKLVAGEVDAITGFSFSSFVNLRKLGVPAEDIVVRLMNKFGLGLYGNVIIVNTDFAKANPSVVTAFLTAVVRGWAETIAHPHAAIESLLARNQDADGDLERQRLRMVIKDNVYTPYVARNGMGDVDGTRFSIMETQLEFMYKFKTPPTVERFFTPIYLPHREARMLR